MIFRFSPSSLSSSSIPVIRTTMHLAHTMSHFLYYTSPTKSLTCTITHICECTNKMLSEMNELAQDLVSGKLQSQDSNTVLERPSSPCNPLLHLPCWSSSYLRSSQPLLNKNQSQKSNAKPRVERKQACMPALCFKWQRSLLMQSCLPPLHIWPHFFIGKTVGQYGKEITWPRTSSQVPSL